jgi:hypothetical protein
MVLNEGNVVGVEYLVLCAIPEPIGFGIWCVTYEGAREGAGKDFGVVSHDERKRATSNFSQMRERRFAAIPKLIRRFATVGRGSCEVRKVCSRGTEFIPHVCGSGTSGQHGTRFVK